MGCKSEQLELSEYDYARITQTGDTGFTRPPVAVFKLRPWPSDR